MKVKSSFKFPTRKSFLRTTSKLPVGSTEEGKDQKLESSNQQSFEDLNQTTELGHLATALQELQQAFVRPKKTTTSRSTTKPASTLGEYFIC